MKNCGLRLGIILLFFIQAGEAQSGCFTSVLRKFISRGPKIDSIKLASDLKQAGYSSGVAERIAQLRPDLAQRILTQQDPKPIKVYRGIHEKINDFNPRYLPSPRSSKFNNIAVDPKSISVTPALISAVPYAIDPISKEGTGIIIEYEIPRFMYVDPLDHSLLRDPETTAEGQIPRKILGKDQSPFITRVAVFNGDPVRVIDLINKRKSIEDYAEWREWGSPSQAEDHNNSAENNPSNFQSPFNP